MISVIDEFDDTDMKILAAPFKNNPRFRMQKLANF